MFLRNLKRVLAVVALLYVACLIYLSLMQRSLLYFPQGTRVPVADTNFSLMHDGVTLRGWVVNPGQHKALIYFGGNGDPIQDSRENFARWAPDRTTYLLAYRGYGASEGLPTEAALFSDALALFDQVRPLHDSIAAMGRSLGSGVATYLASERPVERLLLAVPYDSIARIAQSRFPIFPAAWLMQDKFESWRYAPQVHCPVLIVQAQYDQTIPAASTRRLAAAFTPPPKLIAVPDAGHNSILFDPAYADAVTAFLH